MKANLNWDIDLNGNWRTRVLCPSCKEIKSLPEHTVDYVRDIKSVECVDCGLELIAWRETDKEVMVKRNGEWQPVADEVWK